MYTYLILANVSWRVPVIHSATPEVGVETISCPTKVKRVARARHCALGLGSENAVVCGNICDITTVCASIIVY